ncbi:replication protein A [Microvirga ossetica]|uniref:replication protein A n=1 Tax=Microvirga ossetica TaxID=1882682 RepID=UPI000C1530DF|nr:replication protein A [Microvirga ossetica]
MLDGAAAERCPTPVRRQSRLKGRCEGVFWRRTDRQEVRRITLAARRYELVTRQPGARSGALGFVALEVLEYLANLVDYKTGRLDPAIETLMSRLRRSRDAIVRALKALRTHGFLDWLRRYVPTGNEGRGPQVQQTSNAYRLSLPARALRLLGRFGQPSPLPDDFDATQQRRTAGYDAYRASLSPVELVAETIEDPALRAVLTRLGQGVERESGRRTESQSKFLFYRD